jgi:16S rRNA (guanine(527)-N(7))-methyltransferase RsmG
MAAQLEQFREALITHADSYGVALSVSEVSLLTDYYALLLTWNPRLHLVAPCSPAEFATRHVLESLMLLPHLNSNDLVADIGTGAGLPIIPNLVARPDLRAILIESSQKKAVFLREALRITGNSEAAQVISKRFQDVPPEDLNVVTCRALDQFAKVFAELVEWSPQSKLMLFGGAGLRSQIESLNREFSAIRIPNTERRFLFKINATRS